MPFYEHAGIHFHYELEGTGPALVFCHGLTGNLNLCKEVLGDLPNHRLLVADSRAHGQTFPLGPIEDLTIPTFAHDLLALVNHLQLDTFILGGISMGAAISAAFAVRNPERLRALVLVRPAWEDHPMPENLGLLPILAEKLRLTPTQTLLREIEATPEFQRWSQFSGESVEEMWKNFSAPDAVERRVRLDRIPKSQPILNWSEVATLKMPTLVVGNHRDATHPWEMAVNWSERIPHAQLVEIPSKTDGMEAHQQAFRDQLRLFLESVPEES